MTLKKMIIVSEDENGEEWTVELDDTQTVYVLQYVKDLNHLYFFLDHIVQKWKKVQK
jgi:hypothetical protein